MRVSEQEGRSVCGRNGEGVKEEKRRETEGEGGCERVRLCVVTGRGGGGRMVVEVEGVCVFKNVFVCLCVCRWSSVCDQTSHVDQRRKACLILI